MISCRHVEILERKALGSEEKGHPGRFPGETEEEEEPEEHRSSLSEVGATGENGEQGDLISHLSTARLPHPRKDHPPTIRLHLFCTKPHPIPVPKPHNKFYFEVLN